MSRLLRACCGDPCHSAAEKRDEIAPPHFRLPRQLPTWDARSKHNATISGTGGVQNFEGEARPPRPAANAGKKLDMRQVRFWHNADHSEAAYGQARLEDHNAFVVRRLCAEL